MANVCLDLFACSIHSRAVFMPPDSWKSTTISTITNTRFRRAELLIPIYKCLQIPGLSQQVGYASLLISSFNHLRTSLVEWTRKYLHFTDNLHVHKRNPRCTFYKHMTMMTSSNGNIFRVTGPLCGEFTGPGEFPAQRPVTRSLDVFFDLRLNKPLSKQSWGWWFETLSRSLWRHRNDKSQGRIDIKATRIIRCSMRPISKSQRFLFIKVELIPAIGPRPSDGMLISSAYMCHDAGRDRKLAVSFEVGGEENVPGIPCACATRNFGYLVRGP